MTPQRPEKRFFEKLKKACYGLFTLFVLLTLCACGKMPSDVDPPQDGLDDALSRPYPNPKTENGI